MMRIRMPNGFTNAEQIRRIAEISREFGTGFVDITTRQQIQLRGFAIGDVAADLGAARAVGLVSLQTGMDNIRNVDRVSGRRPDATTSCSTPRRSCASSPTRSCGTRRSRTCRASSTSAITRLHGALHARRVAGSRADAGGQDHRRRRSEGLQRRRRRQDGLGRLPARDAARRVLPAGGRRRPVQPHHAASFATTARARARNRARLAFLIEEWGIDEFRRELERRVGDRLLPQGRDARTSRHHDHLGIVAPEAVRDVHCRPHRAGRPHHRGPAVRARAGRAALRQRRHADDDEPERDRPERARKRAAAADQRAAAARTAPRPARHDARAWSAAPASTTATSRSSRPRSWR